MSAKSSSVSHKQKAGPSRGPGTPRRRTEALRPRAGEAHRESVLEGPEPLTDHRETDTAVIGLARSSPFIPPAPRGRFQPGDVFGRKAALLFTAGLGVEGKRLAVKPESLRIFFFHEAGVSDVRALVRCPFPQTELAVDGQRFLVVLERLIRLPHVPVDGTDVAPLLRDTDELVLLLEVLERFFEAAMASSNRCSCTRTRALFVEALA